MFTIPYDETILERCIQTFTIGHLRDDEGYTKTWFDEENVVKDESIVYNYYVTLPQTIDANSDIYFTLESFYQYYISEECLNNWETPFIWFKITNTRTLVELEKSYYEYHHEPVMIGLGEF